MRMVRWIAAGMVAAAVCAGAVGQNAAPAQRAQPKDLIVSVEFEGGTIGEYVRAIKEAHPEANVVVSPEAVPLPMPEVSIHGASLGSALHITMTYGSTMPGMPGVEVLVDRAGGGEGLPVYKITARSIAPRELRSTVISLAPVIGAGVEKDDILAAMQAAMELFPTRATLRFHEDTLLLLVRGSEEQLDLMGLVAERLKDDASAERASSPAQLDEEIESMKLALASDERALQVRRGAKEKARAEYENLKRRRDSGEEIDQLYIEESQRSYMRASESQFDAEQRLERTRGILESLMRRRAMLNSEKQ